MAEPPENRQAQIDKLRDEQLRELRALFTARLQVLHELPENSQEWIEAIDARLGSFPENLRDEQRELVARMFRAASLLILHPEAELHRGTQISPLDSEFVESVRRTLLAEAEREIVENAAALERFPTPKALAMGIFADWVARQKRAPAWTLGRAARPNASSDWPHLHAEDGSSRGYFMAWDAELGWSGTFYRTTEVQFEIEDEMAKLGLTKATVFATATGVLPPRKSKFRVELVRHPDHVGAIVGQTALVRRKKLLKARSQG